MQYILKDEFQALTESAGTIINISNVAAEISLSQTHGTGIILFPRQKLSFNKSVYAARAPGGLGTAVVAAIETGASSGGSESSSEGFTQSDVDFVFDEGIFTQEDVDETFSETPTIYDGFTQDDVDNVFR